MLESSLFNGPIVCKLHMQATYASYICKLHMQATYASYICKLHMQATYASYICKLHMQATYARGEIHREKHRSLKMNSKFFSTFSRFFLGGGGQLVYL